MARPIPYLETAGTDPRTTTRAKAEAMVRRATDELYDEFAGQLTGTVIVGDWDASSGSFPASTSRSEGYFVNVAGTVDGQDFAVGDWLVALVDAPSTSTYASNWVRGDYSQVDRAARYRRNTAAQVEADSLWTYTSGQPYSVAEGQILIAEAESFPYEVAEASESDPDLTTGGGVKLFMKPTQNNTVRPEQLGMTTSGVFTPAQRRAAFQQLINIGGTRKHEVLIPKDASNWIIDSFLIPVDGVRIIVEGNLENPATAAEATDHSIFNPGTHHPAYWNDDNSYMTWYPCAGVTTGETITPDAGDVGFSVGDLVLIRSEYHWLSGVHQRPLFMQAAVIVAIDGGTGQITLDRGIPEDFGDSLIGLANDDSVSTVRGDPLVMPRGFRIEVPGKLVSARHVMPRGGFIDAVMEFAEVEANTLFFSNLMVDSVLRCDVAKISEKLLDCAGSSLRTTMELGTVTIQGAGEGLALAVMNENSTDCVLRCDTLEGADWAESGGNFKFLNSRRCVMDFGRIRLPKAVSAGVAFTAFDYPESGNEQQPLTEDNVFRLRNKANFGSLGRYVQEDSPGTASGVLAARRNRVEGGDWNGTVSTGYAMEFDGQDSRVEDVRCADGALRTGSTGIRLRARDSFFGGGVSFFNGPSGFDLSGLNSSSNRDLIAARGKSTSASSTQSATEVILDTTKVISAGYISGGDEIDLIVRGQCVGTADTKTISFNVAVDTDDDDDDLDPGDDANKISLTIPASCTDWEARFEGYFRNTGAFVMAGTLMDLTNGTSIGAAPPFGSMDTQNHPVRLELSGLVANTGDLLSASTIHRKARRDGHI